MDDSKISNRIEYWSNHSILFEISNIRTALLVARGRTCAKDRLSPSSSVLCCHFHLSQLYLKPAVRLTVSKSFFLLFFGIPLPLWLCSVHRSACLSMLSSFFLSVWVSSQVLLLKVWWLRVRVNLWQVKSTTVRKLTSGVSVLYSIRLLVAHCPSMVRISRYVTPPIVILRFPGLNFLCYKNDYSHLCQTCSAACGSQEAVECTVCPVHFLPRARMHDTVLVYAWTNACVEASKSETSRVSWYVRPQRSHWTSKSRRSWCRVILFWNFLAWSRPFSRWCMHALA